MHNGDVVFSWSGSLMLRIWAGGRVALNQHLFRVTSKYFPRWFYFGWTEVHLEEFIIIAADKAVTMGHVRRSHLRAAQCVIPSEQLIRIGTRHLEPMLEQQVASQAESRQLETLRDALLPKLLSGEITVPDAEKLAADVL